MCPIHAVFQFTHKITVDKMNKTKYRESKTLVLVTLTVCEKGRWCTRRVHDAMTALLRDAIHVKTFGLSEWTAVWLTGHTERKCTLMNSTVQLWISAVFADRNLCVCRLWRNSSPLRNVRFFTVCMRGALGIWKLSDEGQTPQVILL